MSASIECRAHRRGHAWVAHVSEHGVYGHGRTLKALRDSIEHGLAHINVTAQITVITTTPELEDLRSAEDAYAVALHAAVSALALRATTRADIAEATGVPTNKVKAILADHSASPRDPDPRVTPGPS